MSQTWSCSFGSKPSLFILDFVWQLGGENWSKEFGFHTILCHYDVKSAESSHDSTIEYYYPEQQAPHYYTRQFLWSQLYANNN